ncbi:hypothetical protein FK220_009650 [Flavobacteriaceae bacterium TP-CH-4]|uniref:Uncharacterized protein n=1 Tax=Pelagihabitans pacificus TaxID=2696054 RepID=A0A967AT95_9FLAO|nr:DUF6544 family protein [Pelagihabitans pacificus]NHF59604.1 hypothetical protein [Pelagihabitans pacificus]
MRIVFAVILAIHGLIHLMGFVKAFQLKEISALTQSISKPIGMLWLFATVLFLTTLVFFLLKKDYWAILCLVAALLSQLLIIMVWKDARFGTLANLLILLVAIPGFGTYRFHRMVRAETMELLQDIESRDARIVRENDLNDLPPIVQRWLRHTGVVGKTWARSVRLKQRGSVRNKPDGAWMPFTATQYVDMERTSFIWSTEVRAMPMVKTLGRDKLRNGKGDMLIKLASVIPVVHEGNNDKINTGAALRYLAEICWFPSAALHKNISWQALDASSAKASLSIGGYEVSGVFQFTSEGAMISFEAPRYYGGGEDASLETWRIEAVAFNEFEGIKIPYKCAVIWKLKEGDFEWLRPEITDLEYNLTKPF